VLQINLNDIIRLPQLFTDETIEQFRNRIMQNLMLMIIQVTLWFRAQISKMRPGVATARNISLVETKSEVWNCYDIALLTGFQQSLLKRGGPRPDIWGKMSASTPPFVVLMTIRL
jgi:hypothetical protein